MPRSFCRHALAWVSTLALFACLSAQVPARKPADDSILYSQNGQPYRREAGQTAWRRIPTLVQPPSGSAVDDARDRVADRWFGRTLPLDQPGAPRSGGFYPTDTEGEVPELSIPPGATIIVGTFDSAASFFSKSHLSIYTVLRVNVETVLDSASGRALPNTIEIMQPGGAVQLDGGRVVEVENETNALGPQPGHRYLFVLAYRPMGDFYSIYDEWEIRGGVAVPDTQDSNLKARKGVSLLAGKPERDFVDLVRQRLAAAPTGGGQ